MPEKGLAPSNPRSKRSAAVFRVALQPTTGVGDGATVGRGVAVGTGVLVGLGVEVGEGARVGVGVGEVGVGVGDAVGRGVGVGVLMVTGSLVATGVGEAFGSAGNRIHPEKASTSAARLSWPSSRVAAFENHFFAQSENLFPINLSNPTRKKEAVRCKNALLCPE